MQDQLKNILHALAELEKRVSALEGSIPAKVKPSPQPFGAGGPGPDEPPPKP